MRLLVVVLGFLLIVAAPFLALAEELGPSTQFFKPYEKFDLSNPECFDRIIAALQFDPKAKALYENVMSLAGVTDPHQIIFFQKSEFAFEGGATLVSIDGKTDDDLMPGWQAITSDGFLSLVNDPDAKISTQIHLNANADMITSYSSLIHELTHARRDLMLVHQRANLDVLRHSSAKDYAWDLIRNSGGETDAFVAEISSVIRYRNRTHSEYEAFHTAITERYFDQDTGEVKDRQGLEQYLALAGGDLGYLGSYSSVFQKASKDELKTLRSGASSLDQFITTIQQSNPPMIPPANFDKTIEEARRLKLRADKIQAQFSL